MLCVSTLLGHHQRCSVSTGHDDRAAAKLTTVCRPHVQLLDEWLMWQRHRSGVPRLWFPRPALAGVDLPAQHFTKSALGLRGIRRAALVPLGDLSSGMFGTLRPRPSAA